MAIKMNIGTKLNIGDEVNIKATVVDWNNGFGTVKLRINGLQEDNVNRKELYIRMNVDELMNFQKIEVMKSINEEKPPVGLRVLCQWWKRNGNDKEIYQTIMHRNEDDEYISEFGICNGIVTHWMELPFVI